MSLNLYFKTDEFKSNKELARYFFSELRREGLSVTEPEDEDYMYTIQSSLDGENINIYMGKNDEVSSPTLWQVWPEQSVSLLKRIFGKPNKEPEEKVKLVLQKIVSQINGVSGIEWGI